jgi:2-haloacid dehalogenase
LRTAYVERPAEHGPAAASPRAEPGEFDVTARDFLDLAEKL